LKRVAVCQGGRVHHFGTRDRTGNWPLVTGDFDVASASSQNVIGDRGYLTLIGDYYAVPGNSASSATVCGPFSLQNA
jgi:hypothetical protein